MSDSFSVQFHTFGCKVNAYDTGLMEKRFLKEGFDIIPEKESVEQNPSRVHVLNTCAVTAQATKEAVRLARRLKARDPFCLVVVTGCAAQVDTESFTGLPGVDLVVANSHKGQLETLIRKYYSGRLTDRVYKSNIFKKEDLEDGGGDKMGHTRAFLKIQDGCNSFCTFCVIPFARGKSRSIPVSNLVDRIRRLESQGVRETVLTGVHIGDYEDGNRRLEDLVEAVLRQTGMPRLRLSSLEPVEVSDRLLDLYGDERLCRHFHMSIQSAQTEVLHAMKRKYLSGDVEDALNRIADRVPGAYIGMDVIAGFPGETDEQFEESLNRLRDLPWTRLHVFPYSVRPGTYAARLPQLSGEIIRERARRLRDLSLERVESQAIRQIGQIKKVLALQSESKKNRAISRDYWNIVLEEDGGGTTLSEEFAVQIIGTYRGSTKIEAYLSARRL